MNNNRIPTVGAERRHLNQRLFYAIDADDTQCKETPAFGFTRIYCGKAQEKTPKFEIVFGL